MFHYGSLKTNRPDCFRRIDLFEKTLVILESHHFRLSARRFALELFDKSVVRRIIFGDESVSDSEMSE